MEVYQEASFGCETEVGPMARSGDREYVTGTAILAPEHPVLPLGADVVQVGVGPQALRLCGDRDQIDAALLGLRRGQPVGGAEDLTDALLRHGLAHHVGERDRGRARMRNASLLVEGLGRCGAQIVEHLCVQNVGVLLLRDGRKVGPEDVGGVYRTAHHGLDRAEALRMAMRRRPERTALIGCPPEARTVGADLHVLCTGPGAWETLRRAASESQTVLPVELSAAGFRIGPLVSEGRLVCPDCLRLHALDKDPQWDALQAGLRSAAEEQLRTRRGAAEGGVVGRSAAGQPRDAAGLPSDPQLEPSPDAAGGATDELQAVQAAAMAAHQISTLLAGHSRAAVDGAVLTVDASTATPGHHPVMTHPECSCRTMVL